jgi:hypothetical protein
MALRDIILEVSNGYAVYRDGRTTDAGNPIDRLISKSFPAELMRLAPDQYTLNHVGRCGQGNVSAAPWVASFDPRLTTSAQDGYYPVYLFSTDLKRIYLILELGATQFDRHFGANNTSIERIGEGASRFRKLSEELTPPIRLNQTSIDIHSTGFDRRYRAYEAGTILAYPPYLLDDLPADSILESDYREIIDFYVRVVEDPTIPEVEELVESAVKVVEQTIASEVAVFEPRPPAQPRGRGTGGGGGGNPRRSKESRKVGNAGELAVIAAEKHKLLQAGRPELADQVDHLAARGKTPGWDIDSFDEDGAQIHIEVKASKSSTINSIEITRNEWRAAQDQDIRDKYYIYLVTEALSAEPKIEIIKDPYSFVDANTLSVEPSTWELSLRSAV